jgi:hypothetical protein
MTPGYIWLYDVLIQVFVIFVKPTKLRLEKILSHTMKSVMVALTDFSLLNLLLKMAALLCTSLFFRSILCRFVNVVFLIPFMSRIRSVSRLVDTSLEWMQKLSWVSIIGWRQFVWIGRMLFRMRQFKSFCYVLDKPEKINTKSWNNSRYTKNNGLRYGLC